MFIIRSPRNSICVSLLGWSLVAVLLAPIAGASSSVRGDEVTGLEFVPPDAMAAISVRPSELLSHPGLKFLADIVAADDGASDQFGISPTGISRLTAVPFPTTEATERDSTGIIVHARAPFNAEAIIHNAAPMAEARTAEGMTYYYSPARLGRYVYAASDSTFLLAEREDVLLRMIKAGKTGASRAPWTASWSSHEDAHLTIAANIPALKVFADRATKGAPQSLVESFSPLWNNGTEFVATVTMTDTLQCKATFRTRSADDATGAERAFRAALELAQTQLAAQREQLSQSRRPPPPSTLMILEIQDQLIQAIKIERRDATLIGRTGFGAKRLAETLSRTRAAAETDRGAARRARALNNLKQIALAMHNYHDRHGNFPPAAVVGPDGKTVHSWRVALLPFLGENAVYDRYRQDEPWDSPHNKEVMAEMPRFYRDPDAQPDSTNSAYFVFTGKDTAFFGNRGTQIRDIRDGTSNTLLVVGAKRDIPWTQPVDIAYNPNGALPKLGGFEEGGFTACFADGAATFVSFQTDAARLRAMITIDGGE